MKIPKGSRAGRAKLTISRPYGGRHDDRPCIKIAVDDQDSRIQFLELEVSLADFASALTGMSEVECDMVVRGLQNVGKVRETQTLVIVLEKSFLKERGLNPYGRELEDYLTNDPDGIRASHETDGWKVDTYLRSQHSITPEGKGDTAIRLNLRRYRYVEAPATKEET